MADFSSVVSRTAWYKIVFILTLVIFAALFFIFPQNHTLPPTYYATDPELDLAVVDGIAKTDKNLGVTENVGAVVVPHHLVASEAIALGIKAITASSPQTVVIISPDHFEKCPKLLCTTQGNYETFFGDVAISGEEVGRLLSHKDLISTSDLFVGEHGVYSIVPFIKHYLPDAAIVPIAVSQRGLGDEYSRAEIISVLDQLVSRNDVALVISSDFSHYLPLAEADKKDQKTKKAFCSGDGQAVLDLKNPSQSDCPLCLWIAQQEAKKNEFWNPIIAWHSNSANLLHDTSVQETTSHFTILLSGTASESSCST